MTAIPAGHFDRIVYLLQGGGALGAYQVGVLKGLIENGYYPDWLIGTSIGAVNSAIIAGNPQDQALQKLYGFWETISTKMPPVPNTLNNIFMERWQHFLSAQYTAFAGQPGFFRPRWWNPWLGIESTLDKLSYYDTEEFRNTLAQFIDFDRINEKKVRLSIGAVRVATGTPVFFDNTKLEITLDHVMASAALPPGFPAVSIDNQFYWDGGVHSNTQVNLVLCENEPIRYLCFMVHLFDSYGTRPTNIDEVIKRQKDITYSSHHKQSIYAYKALHNLRHTIRVMSEHLSEEKKADPEVQKLIALGKSGIIHLARFHYKGRLSDLSSKDYEFSLPSVMDHIENGCDDVNRALLNPPWYTPYPEEVGLVLYEVSDNIVKDNNVFEENPHYHVIT